jgi:hypothetical protein
LKANIAYFSPMKSNQHKSHSEVDIAYASDPLAFKTLSAGKTLR